MAKLAQRVGLTVRDVADTFAALPPDPGPHDWARIGEELIGAAEARTAQLRAGLNEMRSGARLCEIVASLEDPESRSGQPGRGVNRSRESSD